MQKGEVIVARLQRRATGDERAAMRAKNRSRGREDKAVVIPAPWDDNADVQQLRSAKWFSTSIEVAKWIEVCQIYRHSV